MAANSRSTAGLSLHDIHQLLPKLDDPDSDIRYMNLEDLCDGLIKAPTTLLAKESNTCLKIIEQLLKTLDDTNGDVQSQALKWYAFLHIPHLSHASYNVLLVLAHWLRNVHQKSFRHSLRSFAV